MYAGASITAETIGTLREVTVEFIPNSIGKLIGAKRKKFVYRCGGEVWFYYPSDKQVDPSMAAFLENAWSAYQVHQKSGK